MLVFPTRRPWDSSPACRGRSQPTSLRLRAGAKLTANCGLPRLQTHPEDVVALGAASRYLHALRTAHVVALLRLVRSPGSSLPSRGEVPGRRLAPGTRRQTTGRKLRMRRDVAGSDAASALPTLTRSGFRMPTAVKCFIYVLSNMF